MLSCSRHGVKLYLELVELLTYWLESICRQNW